MSVLRFPQGASPQDPGSLVARKYRLEELLGEGGGAGAVYRAVDVDLERSFAVRLLKAAPSPDALARFRKDAEVLGLLMSSHLAEVAEAGIDAESGVPYVATELVRGMPLSDLCRSRGALPLAQALPLLKQIADTLDDAHDAGVLHGNLKPGNVFLGSDDPESPEVKIVDFGLVGLLPGSDPKGAPLYLAPERIRRGEATRASDIYSFGVLAYEVLGGKTPFRGTQKEILDGHLEAPPPPLPLPAEIWRTLRATLQKDPALRPASAGEVVRRLLKGLAAQPPTAGTQGPRGEVEAPRPVRLEAPRPAPPRPREPIPAPPPPPQPRKSSGPVAAAVLGAVLLGALGFLLGRGDPGKASDKAPAPESVESRDADVPRDAAEPRDVERRPSREETREPAVPLIPLAERPAEPRTPVAPTSPGAMLGFDDVPQACAGLSHLSNYLCLVNRGSEPAAGGARLVIDESLASFTTRPTFGNAVSIQVAGKERYSLDFGPAKGKSLLPGLYTEAMRWPFNEGPYPGIDFSVGSSGCNTEEGRFRILQIQLTGDGKIRRFVADFETSCNRGIGRISIGQGAIDIRPSEPGPSLPVT